MFHYSFLSPLSIDMKKPYQEQAKIDKEVWVAKHGDYKNLPGIPKRTKKAPTTAKKPMPAMTMEQGLPNPVAAGENMLNVILGSCNIR